MTKKINKWFPVVFLLITWYIPRQTAPGAYLENFIFLRWITFLFIPVFFFGFLLYRLFLRPKIYLTNIAWPVIAIFLVIAASAITNQSSATTTLFTFLIYLRYPLLFIVLLNMGLDKDTLKLFLKVFFFLLIIQIPETFYRYFVLGIRWDHISWTLGAWGHFDLGVYMMYAAALLVSKSLILKMRLTYLVLIFCFFLISLFGEIKAFMFFMPVVAVFVIFTCLGRRFPMRRLQATAMFVVATMTGFVLSIGLYERVFPESSAIKQIRDVLHPGEQAKVRRVSAFQDILGKVEMAPDTFLFGWGPGSSLAGEYLVEEGKISELPIRHKNQLAETFVDIGFMGLIAYYWLLFCLFVKYRRHYKIEKDKIYLFLNRGLMGMWLFYAFLGPLYDLVWRHDSPQYVFFFLSAVLYTRYRQIKKTENENIINQQISLP